jgi:hypothetical protein
LPFVSFSVSRSSAVISISLSFWEKVYHLLTFILISAYALLPVNSGSGRPVELDLRMALNAMFYLVRTGGQWRYLQQFQIWRK